MLIGSGDTNEFKVVSLLYRCRQYLASNSPLNAYTLSCHILTFHTMSEDIQMDIEPAQAAVNANIAAQITNVPAVEQSGEKAFFHWQGSPAFTVSSQIPGTSQLSELSSAQFSAGAAMPPGVVASAQIQQGKKENRNSTTGTLLLLVLCAYAVLTHHS